MVFTKIIIIIIIILSIFMTLVLRSQDVRNYQSVVMSGVVTTGQKLSTS